VQTLHHGWSELLDAGGRTVREVMDEPYALEAGMDLREALSEFLASGSPQLPVLDGEGRITGLVRLHAILSYYGAGVGLDR
jgi:CBS domain-containing protein